MDADKVSNMTESILNDSNLEADDAGIEFKSNKSCLDVVNLEQEALKMKVIVASQEDFVQDTMQKTNSSIRQDEILLSGNGD